MRDIEQKFLPHPLAPFFTTFGVARWAESSCLTGEHKKAFLPTVRTPHASKPAHRITAFEILLDNILDDWPKEAVLPLKTALIFQKELLKIMKKDSVENSPLWMTLTVNPCHGRVNDSRNEPEDMK
jgi:hypothetical protein